jgi:predicted enzyme related to lactoylglutathione lyase
MASIMPLSVLAASVRAMTMKLGGVTIDCLDPRALAEFWSKALGATATDYGGEFVFLAPEGESGPYVGLQRVPEKRVGKNRAHVDFSTDDRPAEVARLVGLGATEVAEHTVPGLTWTVLQDPDGNEFCVGSKNG